MIKKLKSEKGGITLFVIVSILFIMALLMAVYWKANNYQIAVLQSEERIKEIYGNDVSNINNIYNEIINEAGDVTSVALYRENEGQSSATNMITAKILANNTLTLNAIILSNNSGDKSVTWRSSNPEIATVVDGVITAVSAGTATITATANDGSGASATCIVTVVLDGISVAQAFENGVLTWEDIHNISAIISSKFGLTSNDINKTTHKAIVLYKGEFYKLEVGDSFTLKSTDNTPINLYVRIIGFNTDKLAGSSKVTQETVTATTYIGEYAGITFEQYAGERLVFNGNAGYAKMNPTNENNPSASNVGGWGASYIRNSLNIEETLDELENKSYIKYVSKEYNIGNKGNTNSQNPAVDRLWVLSCSEIWPLKNNEYGWCNTNESTMTEGISETRYRFYAETNADCDAGSNLITKRFNNASENDNYWTRSPRYKDTESFFYVYNDGKIHREKSTSNKAVFPCFCI